MKKNKCEHNRPLDTCCICSYGDIQRSVSAENRTRDLVDDLKVGIGFKLIKGFNLLNDRS